MMELSFDQVQQTAVLAGVAAFLLLAFATMVATLVVDPKVSRPKQPSRTRETALLSARAVPKGVGLDDDGSKHANAVQDLPNTDERTSTSPKEQAALAGLRAIFGGAWWRRYFERDPPAADPPRPQDGTHEPEQNRSGTSTPIREVNTEAVREQLKASTMAPAPPEPVEISVFAPHTITRAAPFPVNIILKKIHQRGQTTAISNGVQTYDTLVANISPRSLVSVALESKWLQVDAPYQVLQWLGKEVTAMFLVSLLTPQGTASLPEAVDCILHVMADGIPLGHIPFDLKIGTRNSTKVETGRLNPEVLNQRLADVPLVGHGNGALRYRRVFVSYTEKDVVDVTHLIEGLCLGGATRVHMHAADLQQTGENWQELVISKLKECDAFLLCWSQNAVDQAGNVKPGIQFEIDYALELEAQKERNFKLLVVITGTEKPSPLPQKLKEKYATSPYFRIRVAGPLEF